MAAIHNQGAFIGLYANGYVCRRQPLNRVFPHMRAKRPVYVVSDPDGNYIGYVDTQREARALAAQDANNKG